MIASIVAVYPARIIGQVVDKIVAVNWMPVALDTACGLVGIILVAYITESIWTYLFYWVLWSSKGRVKLLRITRKKIRLRAFRTGDIITRSSEERHNNQRSDGIRNVWHDELYIAGDSVDMMVTTISLPLTIAAIYHCQSFRISRV